MRNGQELEVLKSHIVSQINKYFMIYSVIISIFWSLLILFIWFSTDAFIEYCKLLKIYKYTKVDLYMNYKENVNPKISYFSWIKKNYNSFFTRMISCIPCFGFWASLLVSTVFSTLYYFPIVYITCLLYTSPSPRDLSTSRMPSSA